MQLHPDDTVTLEKMIDSTSLRAVLVALGSICREKEAHVMDNWQDKALSRQWSKAARVVERASDSIDVLALP